MIGLKNYAEQLKSDNNVLDNYLKTTGKIKKQTLKGSDPYCTALSQTYLEYLDCVGYSYSILIL